MSKPRILLVILVFVALAALELVTGFNRLAALRAGRTRELRDAVGRGHEELARRLGEVLGAYERQARFLAQLDEVAAVLLPGPDAAVAPVPPALLTCLDSFDAIEQVLVLDGDGASVLRLGRDAEGRPARLRPTLAVPAAADQPSDDPRSSRFPGGPPLAPPPPDPARLARALRDGVRLDDLEPDRPAPGPLVAEPIGSPRGWLVLSLSAVPLQAALSGFRPFEQQFTRLVVLDGEASTTAGAVAAGADRAPVEGDLFVATSAAHAQPPFRLETTLPAAAVAAAMERIGREYSFVVGSMIVVTLALGIVGALVLRLGLRALRLNETEHYLRWIRRVTDRYRALQEGAADMILILEPGGALREANAAARQTLSLDAGPGAAQDAAPAERTTELLARLPGDGAERFTAAVLSAGAEPGRTVSLPGLALTAADGAALVVDAHVAGVDVGGEHVVQVSLRDVTRQRAVERRLQTAERLGSLGLLTAGVAHEINNPLEGMGNYLGLLERGGLPPERERHYLGEVRRGLHRIRDIVRDLLAFARPSMDSGRADLAAVVREALGMVRYASDFERLTVEQHGLDQPLPVAGDPGRLGQVVLNLLLNAGKALAGSGTISLTASHARDDDGRALLVLDVADDGPGLPPAALGSLFDPFFSGSGGTGLGLAVSFGIVEAHGGTLTATNRPSGGACLRLCLPALLDDDPHESDSP